MKKNRIRVLIVSAITLIAFSALAFAVPFVRSTIFWFAYAFGVLSILAQYPLYTVAFRKGSKARSKFYGFPLIRLGLIYLVAQMLLSVISMSLAKYAVGWLAVLLSMFLVCAIAVGYIAATATRDEVERQDTVLRKNVELMRALQSKISNLVTLSSDAELTRLLAAFAEKMRYSDPVSSDKIAEAEQNLQAAVDELEKAVIDGDTQNAVTLTRRADALLAERNRLCKLNK